ncbi:hypothetical protein GMORB2_4079 [Geosmithia morbida]|uniref:Pyridoxamine 5'-phosphate oxidase Alr4036 family FMN-binding domain-containing protein n=1 Tax=Geosmithia morbida TaxID=1094350 RepID=A0A9P5D6Y2_9HYPO|nr:uncharacterized protein GMORB2_4079 [Geosmithia morbida]KAF4125240.1 hypothetical protein GMORB2_4079 [Geosmithia morbida]
MTTDSAAPWRHDFLSHLETTDERSFVLSTLHYDNPASLNPSGIYETDLATITTDIRMEKWRMRGCQVYIVGRDIESEDCAPTREALSRYMRRANASADLGEETRENQQQQQKQKQKQKQQEQEWSWNRELTAHFGNLSPLMRGTFRNPPPGTRLVKAGAKAGAEAGSDEDRTKEAADHDDGLGLGQEVHDLEDEVARRNFCVLVLVPDELDRLDLSNPKRARRWIYSRRSGGDTTASEGARTGTLSDTWDVVEVWP